MTDPGMVEVDRQDLEEALSALERVDGALTSQDPRPWLDGAGALGGCHHDASAALTDLEDRAVDRLQRALRGLPR